MKAIIIITLGIFLFFSGFTQKKDHIIGKWGYYLNERIEVRDIMFIAHQFGFDTTNFTEKKLVYNSLLLVVVSRCEYSEIEFFDYKNQITLNRYNPNDPTIVDTEWGTWKSNNNGTYTLNFENREEIYKLNRKTGELFYYSEENTKNYISKILNMKLKMIKIDY